MRPPLDAPIVDPAPAAIGLRALRRVVTLSLTVAALGFVPAADAQSPIIQGWLAVNTQCKAGPSDDPKTQKACERRDQLSERLKRRGCEYQADGDWWRCPPRR